MNKLTVLNPTMKGSGQELTMQVQNAVQTQIMDKLAKNASRADVAEMWTSLSAIPLDGLGIAPWVERPSQDGTGYFRRGQRFPDVTVTDAGSAALFIANHLTTRENESTTAFATQKGSFAALLIVPSASIDQVLSAINFGFTASSLDVTATIEATITVKTVTPKADGTGVELTDIVSYWRGNVVTGDGQNPILTFMPWLRTYDTEAFSGSGNVVTLQPFIYRPIVMPSSQVLDLTGGVPVSGDRPFINLNEALEVKIDFTTSNPDLRTTINVAAGNSVDQINLMKELIAASLTDAVGSFQ